MSNTKILDGHTWTDRGDGVYLPDEPYTIAGWSWPSEEIRDGMVFVFVPSDKPDDIDGCTLLAFMEGDCGVVLGKCKDEFRAQGLRVASMDCCHFKNEIGGVYAI